MADGTKPPVVVSEDVGEVGYVSPVVKGTNLSLSYEILVRVIRRILSRFC